MNNRHSQTYSSRPQSGLVEFILGGKARRQAGRSQAEVRQKSGRSQAVWSYSRSAAAEAGYSTAVESARPRSLLERAATRAT